MPTVARFSVTPVKGTALYHPEAIELTANGLPENRLFYLIDRGGRMVNGKRHGELVSIRAAYDPAARTLELQSPRARVSAAVSTTRERTQTDFFGRPVRGAVVAGPFSEYFSEHVGEPVRLVQADVPGAGVDVHPVTLLSTASAAYVREVSRAPEAGWLDRFRILIEIDGADPFEEESWEGRSIALGDAVLAIVGPVPRCVVTTQNPCTGMRDFDTLAALHRLRGELERELSTPTGHLPDGGRLILGVYATVVTPGLVRCGHEVRLMA